MKTIATISAENLSIGYPRTKKKEEFILHEDFSFELYAGELTCLLGANGAGKSTLLRTIAGLQQPLSGKILLQSRDLQKYTEQELSTQMGLVLTDKTTAGGFTVSELVSLGRYPYTGFFGKLSSKDNEIVERAMNDVCIIHKSKSYIAELSDGERQKVMIAKALAQECPVIILDEPTAFLDVVNRIEIMNLLHDLATNLNKTILLSTHDIELALVLADRLWLLAKNKGLKTGMTEDLILSNSIDEYLGSKGIHFEKQSGRFLSELKTSKDIQLQAEGDLYYWTKNFLSRNGYQLSDRSPRILQVVNPNFIILKTDLESQTLTSFDELRSHL